MSDIMYSPLALGARVVLGVEVDEESEVYGGRCDIVQIEVPPGEGMTVATAIKKFLRVEAVADAP